MANAQRDTRETRRPPSAKELSPRTLYLTFYNLTFSALWFGLLLKSLSTLPHGKYAVFDATATTARWVQTFSLIEILHAATGTYPVQSLTPSQKSITFFYFPIIFTKLSTGLIKSPVSTTALQVTTRTIQVWAIWYCFPSSTADSHAYGALVLAWSLADGVRYAYLAANMHGVAPGWLVWLR